MDADGNRVEFEINDEIRGVMDRMLASEEEIEKSRAVREAERLAHILTEQGISDDVSERYRDVVTDWLGQIEESEFKRSVREAVQNMAQIIRMPSRLSSWSMRTESIV